MNQENKIKLGIDLHGVIDLDPVFFSKLSKIVVDAGGEIHIMTGQEISPALFETLKKLNITWTHIYSIASDYKERPGIKMWYDAKGRPWIRPDLWDMAKSQYAKDKDLDLVLDDTEKYGESFSTGFGLCKIPNKSGKIIKTKAVAPPEPTE